MNDKELEIIQNFFVDELKKRNPAFFGTIHLNLDEHYYGVLRDSKKFVLGYINRVGRQFSDKEDVDVLIRAAFNEGLHFHFIICLPENPLIMPKANAMLIRNIKNYQHQEFCMSAGHRYWRDYVKEKKTFLKADCKLYFFDSNKNGIEYTIRNKNLPYKFKEFDCSDWNGDPKFYYWTNMKSIK